jgi:hypothetical protein
VTKEQLLENLKTNGWEFENEWSTDGGNEWWNAGEWWEVSASATSPRLVKVSAVDRIPEVARQNLWDAIADLILAREQDGE